MKLCLVCGKTGYEDDLLWHVRQVHLVPNLERPEDIDNADLRALVNQWRRETHILVGVGKAADARSES